MKNVGWLAKEHPFSVGPTSAEFRTKLAALIMDPVNVTRGFHTCDFCDVPPLTPHTVIIDGELVLLGHAEIHVRHKSITYAAPTLIYHYVVTHDYKPPDVFVEAVLNT